MSEATTDENLQRFASSPYAPSWQKEVVAELCAARERIRQLEERIKKAERSGDAGPTGEEIGCPWCGEEILPPPSETKHAVGCEAFTPEGEVK